MPEVAEFEPDWFSPPGHTVAERLRRTGKPLQDFKWEMDFSDEEVERLLDGRLELTEHVASRLQCTLGVPTAFWLNREAQFRRDMRRVAETIPVEDARAWLAALPVRDMAQFGWISSEQDLTGKVAECLRYFDVESPERYEQRVERLVGEAKLRTSKSLKSKPGSLSAWLRRGEIEAELAVCSKWDPDTLRKLLLEIRKLSLIREPNRFLPKLKSTLASAGVALVIARAPSGCRASGATKFLSSDKALLMLSFRYLSDDHFWFSFFHECGHLLLHGNQRIFIEGEMQEGSELEREADDFAEKCLLPQPWHRLLDKLPPNRKEVVRFAVRAGVSPGIVVGQLQHRKRIEHNFLNYLKRRYRWS